MSELEGESRETNWNAVVLLLILFGVIWLVWTGYIWYVFALVILGVAGYVVIKRYSAQEEEQPVSLRARAAHPTIIREKEVIKEVVMIPCKYCGALMPQTAVSCTHCGARRG